ncbi:MAG: hypothetical protein JRJ77_12100 [Deltaproteobacteria bacterium]|nr:hypothetical protein [Deltaproteobacteria bacterium]
MNTAIVILKFDLSNLKAKSIEIEGPSSAQDAMDEIQNLMKMIFEIKE